MLSYKINLFIFCYEERGFMKKSHLAFTLAEVLITLGIVGVVAALTIPTLINKCQKIIWAKQLQKDYAVLTQAFKRILADNDTTSLSETELWSKIEDDGRDLSQNTSYCENFWSEFSKYAKISIQQRGSDKCAIFFPSGSMMGWYSFDKKANYLTDEKCKKAKELGGTMCNSIARIDIDINGEKNPNQDGVDRFEFFMSNEGVLYPSGGKDCALFEQQENLDSNTRYWKYYFSDYVNDADMLRTGQVVEEGWKINYTYKE
jgi:prepilin-type N-terminal cleavage/methylation domain-containing protein